MFIHWDDHEGISEDYFDGSIKYAARSDEGHLLISDYPFTYSSLDKENHQILDYLSDKKKILVSINKAYFHFLAETIPTVVSEIEKADKNNEEIEILFIGNASEFSDTNDGSHINHVIEYAVNQINKTNHTAGYLEVSNNGTQARLKNFRWVKVKSGSMSTLTKIEDFMKAGLELRTIKPHRKLYLSRKRTLSNNQGFRATKEDYAILDVDGIRDKYQYTINDRVDDERRLEAYLETLGFESISPENIKSYEDQIKLMAETKTIVSLTSSGITSAIYMQPGGTIVELMTPLIIQNNKSLHTHYLNLAYAKRLSYIMIPHYNSAEEIINHIEGDPTLKDFLKNV